MHTRTRHPRAFLIACGLLALALTSCDDTESSGDVMVDTATSDTGVADSATDTGVQTDADASSGDVGDCNQPADVDRSCGAAADCAIVEMVADCCGTRRRTGVNTDDENTLLAWEAACGIEPVCECVSRPTQADDGTATTDPDEIVVECAEGICTTTVPDGGVCGDFPGRFDTSCSVDADCAIGFHQIDCCGTREALGIASSEEAAFQQAESLCASTYPGCGCPALPTTAQDGQSGPDGDIDVSCDGGTCLTFFATTP